MEAPTLGQALRMGWCRGCMLFFSGVGGPAQLCTDNKDGRCPGRQAHPARDERGSKRKETRK